jgi:hypothetical protein
MQRIWLVVGCLLVATCLVSGFSFAQDNQVVRVGVVVLGNANGITPTAGRDRLVKALNKQKKSQVQAVPLEGSGGDQASADARQKNCEFVVFTTVTEAHAESQATQTGTGGSFTNNPEFHATVEYKLYRLSDATPVATGSARAHEIGSQGEVVGQALDNVAKKVVVDIKSAAATAPAPTPK